MPIIDAMLVTKTDISVAWERKWIAAPVMPTLTKPSASGSAAAASDPKTSQQDQQHDREAGRLGRLQVLLRQVLHARPERLLAHEVRLHPVAGRRACADVLAQVHGHVGQVVALAGGGERHHGDGAAAGLALGGRLRPLAQLDVGRARRDPVDALDLRADVRRGRRRPLRQHHCQRLALRALEALERVIDRLGPGARHVEAPAGEVLGLPGGKGRGGEQQDQPRSEHEPATTLEESRELVHGRLHAGQRLGPEAHPLCECAHKERDARRRPFPRRIALPVLGSTYRLTRAARGRRAGRGRVAARGAGRVLELLLRPEERVENLLAQVL